MSVQITIRNVPGHVRDTLAERAAQDRQSMQEYLLGALEHLAERPSPSQWLERVRRRKADAKIQLQQNEDAKIQLQQNEIVRHRDTDRR